MSNKELALQAVGELFGQKDPSAVDRWVTADYRQHSTLVTEGPEPLRDLAGRGQAGRAGKNLLYTTVHRVVAEGDFVLLRSEAKCGVPVAYWGLFRVATARSSSTGTSSLPSPPNFRTITARSDHSPTRAATNQPTEQGT
ncbi:nuclear transport factor 2 family protein [Streptomyces sp. CT34]|uniref:nuclear transport factor 2 family protein n=1 Tax=Streptomyces sp. CT34 TaxID=1553907 RepID=UPI001F516C52|nr:nuclear transport factor 2 family protein [Streptomyces sp. CT34]